MRVNSQPRWQKENLANNLALVEEVKGIAAEKGCKPGQLALAWVLHQGDDVFPIPCGELLKLFWIQKGMLYFPTISGIYLLHPSPDRSATTALTSSTRLLDPSNFESDRSSQDRMLSTVPGSPSPGRYGNPSPSQDL